METKAPDELKKGCEKYARKIILPAKDVHEVLYDKEGVNIRYARASTEYIIIADNKMPFPNDLMIISKPEELQKTIALFKQNGREEVANELERIANSIEAAE